MATVKSDHALAGAAGDAVCPKGVVLCGSGEYTCASALASGTVMEMVALPKGALILSSSMSLSGVVGAASSTVALGFTGGDVNALETAKDATAMFSVKNTGHNAAIVAESANGIDTPLVAADTVDIVTAGGAMAIGTILRASVTYIVQ